MELKNLINGTYWLVTAKGLTVTDYYIIHNKIDPINDPVKKFDILLLKELCADHDMFEHINDNSYNMLSPEDINIESQVITQNSIDKYGKQFFIDFINTKDLLKWQLLYKKI